MDINGRIISIYISSPSEWWVQFSTPQENYQDHQLIKALWFHHDFNKSSYVISIFV